MDIDGERKHRFFLRDTKTGNFHESILEELGEDSTTAFILDALKRFTMGSVVTITIDGYHYNNAFMNVSRHLHISVRRQRCPTHLIKDLKKKAYDSGRKEGLMGAIDLINYM